MHKPGTYDAAINDYGFSKDKKGNPNVFVIFSYFDEESNPKKITWFGSFNGGAKEITTKTLVQTLGYQGSDGSEIAEGIESGALDEKREYQIVLETHTYNDQKKVQIKYINIKGEQRQMEKLDKSDVKKMVGGLNLKAEFASQKKQLPKGNKPVKGDDGEDVPF